MMCLRGYKRLLADVALVAILGFATSFGIRWWLQPRHEGRTMAQWLRVLSSEPGMSGSPLDIIRTHVDTKPHTVVLEVPLSYDLLREHDFFDGWGKIGVVIGRRAYSVPCLRGTNGNCLLLLDWGREQIAPGPHEVQVDFMITSRAFDHLHSVGSARAIIFDNSPTRH